MDESSLAMEEQTELAKVFDKGNEYLTEQIDEKMWSWKIERNS